MGNSVFTPLPSSLLRSVDAYWADLLECSLDTLRAGHAVTGIRSASPAVVALRRFEQWVITTSAEVARRVDLEQLRGMLNRVPNDGTQDWVLLDFLAKSGLMDVYGPAKVSYVTPDAFTPLDVPPGLFRRLTTDDMADFEAFAEGMGGHLDYRIGDPRFPYVIGAYMDGTLASVGAVQIWNDLLAETYGDTLPSYRGRGLAGALVSELTRWILDETPYIPQEDGLRANQASMRIGKRLGYIEYGTLLMTNLSLHLDQIPGILQSLEA